MLNLSLAIPNYWGRSFYILYQGCINLEVFLSGWWGISIISGLLLLINLGLSLMKVHVSCLMVRVFPYMVVLISTQLNIRGDPLQVSGVLFLCIFLLSEILSIKLYLLWSPWTQRPQLRDSSRLHLGSLFLCHGLETLFRHTPPPSHKQSTKKITYRDLGVHNTGRLESHSPGVQLPTQ